MTCEYEFILQIIIALNALLLMWNCQRMNCQRMNCQHERLAPGYYRT